MFGNRQNIESNIKRSKTYKKTASARKLNGHKSEHVFADVIKGKVVLGTKKPDVFTEQYGYVSVKRAAKLQLALYSTDRLNKDLGSSHPYAKAATAQRAYYEDRHFNNEKNSKSLFDKAYRMNIKLANWLNKDDNFVSVLDYVMTANGEVDYLCDMWDTNDKKSYLTKMSDVLNAIKESNPIAEVTQSGLRVSVSIDLPNGIRRKAFSLEVRSDANHCRGMLFKAESKWFLKELIRKYKSCQCFLFDK